MLFVEGPAPFSIIILSALIHEGGHLLAMQNAQAKVKRVDIMPLGAGIVTEKTYSYKDDVKIYLGGPFVNLAVFVFAFGVGMGARSPYLLFFAVSNLFLGCFNLLPIPGNDGYMALSAWYDDKYCREVAEKKKKRVRTVAFWILVAFLILSVYVSEFNPGMLVLASAAYVYKKD